MLNEQKYYLVLTTVANLSQAKQLATLVIKQKLAACVNILPAVQSIFHWQGQIVQEEEILLYIKTTGHCYSKLEAMIKQVHAYELPEIIAIPLQGSIDYLSWLSQAVR